MAARGISLPQQKVIMDGNVPYDMVMGNFTKLDYNHDLMVELVWTCYKIGEKNSEQQMSIADEISSVPHPDGDKNADMR